MQRHIRKSFLVIIFIFFAAAFSHTEIYGSIMDEYIQTPLFSYRYQKVPWAENAIEVLSSYGIISGLRMVILSGAYIQAEYTKIIISLLGFMMIEQIFNYLFKPTDWHNKYIGSAVNTALLKVYRGLLWC